MPTLTDLNNAAGPDVVRALADDDRDGIADDAVIAAVIETAVRSVEAETRRAGVDVSASPALEDAAVALAVLGLFERRREPVPPHWVDRAARARELARRVGDGAHPLSHTQSASTRDPGDRAFGPGTLRGL